MKKEEIIESLGDFMNDAVVISEAEPVDHPGPRIVWCNKAFTEMTGYELEEVVGKTPRMLQGEDTNPKTRARIRAGLESWSHIRETILNYDKNGQPFWVELDIRPVADETGWFHYWVAIQRDVTERKEMELDLARQLMEVKETKAELEAEKQKIWLQSLVAKNTTNLAVVTDAEGGIIWANSAFEALTGYTLDEVRGKKPGRVLQGPNTSEATSKEMSAQLAQGRGGSFEILNYSKTGQPYWIALTISPVVNDAGELEHFIAIEEDITARKTAEEELMHSHAELQLALNRADKALSSLKAYQLALDEHAIVAMTDRAGRVTFVNEAFCQASGYTREELLGKNHRILNSDVHPPEFFRQLWQTISTGNSWNGEICNQRKDGSYYWVDTTIIPLKDERGRVESYVSIRYNITKRKQAIEELERSEERFHLAVDGSFDGIWDADFISDHVYFSPRYKEILGYDRDEENFPSTFADTLALVHPEDADKVVKVFEAHLDNGTPYTVEHRLRLKDGSYRWFRARGQAVWDKDGSPTRMVGSTTDVDQLISARLQSEKALEATEQANRLKSEFLANMSHEIRTPLNGILGMAQILERTQLDDKQHEFLSTIRSSGDALLAIINDVLDISKIEAGLTELVSDSFDVSDLLSQTADAIRGIAAQKNIELRTTLIGEERVEAIGDAKRIRQILINLAGNAVKFTDAGSVELKADLVGDGKIRFSVTDTGIGIKEDQLDHIFGRFTQADGSASRRYGGTGLGLAISKDLVELMGGEIGVTSEYGQGSTFWFTMPLSPNAAHEENTSAPAPDPVPSTPTPEVEAPAATGPRKILLAEDNRANQDLINACMGFLDDVELTIVETGAEALEALEKTSFELVLMDINMPVMTGDEASRRIRASGKPYADIPIIALTANALTGQREQYLEDGATAYISKPIDVHKLLTLVRDTLFTDTEKLSEPIAVG